MTIGLPSGDPTSAQKSTTIVVIGAGFSGAMTAVNLLRHSSGRPLRVVLVNKSGRMARGIAYGTRSAEHVLNVPAGNMSAIPEEPDDFLRFCRWADPSPTFRTSFDAISRNWRALAGVKAGVAVRRR